MLVLGLHRGHERLRGHPGARAAAPRPWPAFFSGVAHHTRFGRHLYAIGGNREAAFYSGISIEKHIVGVFTLMGLLSAVAGIVLTARVGAATSDAGRIMELDAIAAAVIGGTSLLGGQGTVWGALLGALVMASLDNGMSLMNTEAFWQPIIKGSILVAAVAVDMAGPPHRGADAVLSRSARESSLSSLFPRARRSRWSGVAVKNIVLSRRRRRFDRLEARRGLFRPEVK